MDAAPVFVASLRGGIAFSAAAAAAGGAGAAAAVAASLPPRDEALRVEAAWILAFLTAKEAETVSELVRVGMVPALVEAFVDSKGQVWPPSPPCLAACVVWQVVSCRARALLCAQLNFLTASIANRASWGRHQGGSRGVLGGEIVGRIQSTRSGTAGHNVHSG